MSGHSVCRSGVPIPGRPPPQPPPTLPPGPTSSPAASSAVGLVPAESTESRSCSIAAPATKQPRTGPDSAATAATATAYAGPSAPPPGPLRNEARRDWLRLASPASGSAPPSLSGPRYWIVPRCLPRLVLPAAVHNRSRPSLRRKSTPRARPLPIYMSGKGGAQAGCQGDEVGPLERGVRCRALLPR